MGPAGRHGAAGQSADFGTPTTRKRLFIQARCDGRPIVWPTPTHGKGRAESWRPASEIIDWSLDCPSIFERKRPLAEATLRRVATGIQRFVINASDPFILPVTHGGGTSPFIVKYHGGSRGHTRGQPCDEPVRTLDTSNRFALVEPFVVRHGHYSTITGAGMTEGCGAGTFRGQSLRTSLATICATNDKHLVCPIITKHFGGPNGHPTPGAHVKSPLGAVTARDHHALSAAFLTKFYGTSTGSQVQLPLPTVLGGGGRGGGHLAEVRAFLIKYYGSAGRPSQQSLFDPLATATTKARFGLVMVHGVAYEIVDIGMRMLSPAELFAAQGFPDDYEIAPDFNGRPLTKTAQTALAGNSVCPQVAAALVAANTREWRSAA